MGSWRGRYILQFFPSGLNREFGPLRTVQTCEAVTMSDKSPTYLFRPARQATLPPAPPSTRTSTSSTISSSFSATRTASSLPSSTSLTIERRQAAGTCRADESTCPQAGWCCNKDEACSLEGGAFFCCPIGAGKEGCVRVCAAGDFQCGGTTSDSTGICCANGQTCVGGDTPLPFCANTGTSSSKRMTTALSTSQTSTSSESHSHTSTITSSRHTLTLNPDPLPSTTTITFPDTSSLSASPTETPTQSPGRGLSIPAQIAAIIIPLVIITLIVSCIFRCRRKKKRGTRIQSTDFSTDFSEQNSASSRTTSTGAPANVADGLSFYSAYSSYPKTPPPPPPTFSAGRMHGRDTKEEDGEVMSLHERYMMESRMFQTPTPQSPVGGPGVGGGVGRGL
ncbi:hypothetical protein QBC40DRAFT_188625 [Triangularia verruculosa]|uniref:Uncharacterized protein n=1 Tax=Triangularia verruculosa TaxID=2587418 RepID=A0AAN6X7F0_9PEZI|nr:hypothetical protein QBC40DRAFT_188625 [Triangularia verruculosa]